MQLPDTPTMFETGKPGIRGLLLIFAIATFLGGCDLTLQRGELRVEIGEFQSRDSGMRAAIKKLATEAEKHPSQEVYRIVWTGPYSDETETDRQFTNQGALLWTGGGPVKAV